MGVWEMGEAKISGFEVRGLHGYRNLSLTLNDNTLVLVGTNGSGKTTVLRLFAGLLMGNLEAVHSYEYESLVLSMDGVDYQLRKDVTQRVAHYFEAESAGGVRLREAVRLSKRFGILFREAVIDESKEEELAMFCESRNLPGKLVREARVRRAALSREGAELQDVFSTISKKQISPLYLPTYRRTEADFEHIMGHVSELMEDLPPRSFLRTRGFRSSSREYRRRRAAAGDASSEMIEFGMEDVVGVISASLDELKNFSREKFLSLNLGHFRDLLTHEYSEVDMKRINALSEEDVSEVLEKIPEGHLTAQNIKMLRKAISSAKEKAAVDGRERDMCDYFLKLQDLHRELAERESAIKSFFHVCTELMHNKSLVYDAEKYEFSLLLEHKGEQRPLELGQLSYGEKQIVSIFCYMYLSKEKRFVIIDEPELSLSVLWQETFLEKLRSSKNCSGLLAATHSPFVFEDGPLNDYVAPLTDHALEG